MGSCGVDSGILTGSVESGSVLSLSSLGLELFSVCLVVLVGSGDWLLCLVLGITINTTMRIKTTVATPSQRYWFDFWRDLLFLDIR